MKSDTPSPALYFMYVKKNNFLVASNKTTMIEYPSAKNNCLCMTNKMRRIL